MGKNGMYGLEWVDENTLKGEMPEDEFEKIAARGCKLDREINPGQVAMLNFPVFSQLCGYRSMDFKLIIYRTACSGGTIWREKGVLIVPGPKCEDLVVKLLFMRGKEDCSPSLLNYRDSGGDRSVSLRKRVEELISLAERDIRWCEKNGEKLLKRYKGKVFGKVGKIATVNRMKRKRRR